MGKKGLVCTRGSIVYGGVSYVYPYSGKVHRRLALLNVTATLLLLLLLLPPTCVLY